MSRIPSSRLVPPGAAVLVLLLAALLAGCGGSTPTGSSSPSTSAAAEGTFPVTVKAANGPLTLKARPERVVSLSPTTTEMLFAIGAGSQVAAVDDQSNYPAEAPKTELSAYKPNLEAIAAKDPDDIIQKSIS